MIEIAFSSSFKKSFRKRIKGSGVLEEKFWNRVQAFKSDPYEKSLKTHKLSGKLKKLWSFTVDYDCRVVFYFEARTKAIFIDIGTHDEVY